MEERLKIVLKPLLARALGQVDVVISRNDRHLDRARYLIDKASRFGKLTFEGEVRDVAGDDEVIGTASGFGKHGVEVIGAENARAAEKHVRVAGQPLVEEQASPFHAHWGKDMKIRNVCNAEHRAMPAVAA